MRIKVFLFFIIISLNLKSQNVYDYFPKIVPPSPVAQVFMRYGEIPIDYSTGIPNISIDLYTVKSRKLELPISISYHASGIKVNDIASEVGLGWVLNCGGLISRTVNGIRDESKTRVRTFFNSRHLLDSLKTSAPTFDYSSRNLQGIMNFEYFFKNDFDNQDPMSDRFFYKLPNGIMGIFTYDYYKLNDDENSIITLPYRPYKIVKYIETVYPDEGTIKSFKIIDEKGIIYIFESYLITAKKTCSEWFLTKIISPDYSDTIILNYEKQNAQPIMDAVSYIYQGEAKNIQTQCYPSELNYSLKGPIISPLPQFTTPILKSITSSTVIIKFEYGNREDFTSLKRLTEITIAPIKSQSNIIKKVQFNHKYFGNNPENKRLCLDNLVISSTEGNSIQKYSFRYIENPVLPPYPRKMSVPVFNEDYWGYYNGSNSNSPIPRDFISNANAKQYCGGNRDSDPTGYFAKACLLKEIIYPTGGKTVFKFERHYSDNLYTYKTNPTERGGYVGGFRIYQIINYDENDNVTDIRTYEYSGAVFRSPKKEYFSFDQCFVEECQNEYLERGAEYSREIVLSNPKIPLEVAPGLPIVYTKVVEYNGTPTNNSGKIVYNYSYPYSPSPENLDQYPQHPIEFELLWYYHTFHYDKGNYVPKLVSKIVYSYNGITYQPISLESYTYTGLFTREFNTGINLTRTKIYYAPEYFAALLCYPSNNPLCDFGRLINDYIMSVVAIDTKAYQETDLIKEIKEYNFNTFDSTKYTLINTFFDYDSNYLQLRRKTISTSKAGINLITEYKYPFDFINISPYSTLVNDQHNFSLIIEQTEAKKDYFKTIKTNYYNWGNNIIAPITIETNNSLNSNFETRIRYHSYDNKGNVTSLSKEGDIKTSYYWGYNQTYPIIEAKNVTYDILEQKVNQAKQQAGITDFSEITEPSKDSNQRTKWLNFNKYLRSLLGDVMITTYTYKPLIGMTSTTDENGKTTYYEYDSFGRLQYIKDQDLNIIKEYKYHYKE